MIIIFDMITKGVKAINYMSVAGLACLLAVSLSLAQQFHPDYERGNQADLRGKREEANRYYLSAAEAGELIAQIVLAQRLAEGIGGAKDEKQAAYWYRRAAENPKAWSAQMQKMGEIYEKGQGVPRDDGEAARWYLRAAEHAQKRPPLQEPVALWFKLGELYEHGKGLPKDSTQALEWYRKAANSRMVVAQVRLGTFYETGLYVPQDYTEAARYYRAAASVGYPDGQYRLALLYQRGLGVQLDHAEAVKLLQQAAGKGHIEALYALGLAYEQGYGVPKDSVEAAKWFSHAAEKGHETAAHKLEGAARTKALRFRAPIIPVPTQGTVPKDVLSLIDEINRELAPRLQGGESGNWSWSSPSDELQKKIRSKGKAISNLVQPLLRGNDLDQPQLSQRLHILAATGDPGALDTLIDLYKRKGDEWRLNDKAMYSALKRAIGHFESNKAGEFLVSLLHREADPLDTAQTLELLARMQYVPALPAISMVLAEDHWPDWFPVAIYGTIGDAAVPFLIDKIEDKEPRVRQIAIYVLGQWLIPREAASEFEQHYWRENNPEIRRHLILGLQNLVSNFDHQITLVEKILTIEQDHKTKQLAREWRDGIDSMNQTVTLAKANKKPSPEILQREIDAYLRSQVLDFEVVLHASTAADEPRLKQLRAQNLARTGPQNYGPIQKINRIILINRAVEEK